MVFIPAYNCERQITRVLAQFTPDIQRRFAEIVVIDNRSQDKTPQSATAALKTLTFCKATLLQNNQNYGLGGSHKVAFQYALKNNYDHCLVLHGDDQGDINDILSELDRGEHLKYDCLLNSRFMPGSHLKGYSLIRTLGNLVFNLLFSLVTLRMQWDLGSGLCCYSKGFLQQGLYLNCSDDLTFCYGIPLVCAANGVRQKFFPSSWREDDQVSNVKLIRQTLQLIELLFVYVFKRKSFSEPRPSASGFNYSATLLATNASDLERD